MLPGISSGARTHGAKRQRQTRLAGFQDAKCTNCHDGLLLTDQQYHNVGIGMDAKEPDLGRGAITKNRKRTALQDPTLRDISKSAPYFTMAALPPWLMRLI